MQEVGIGAMLVPPYPGVLCAMGCASANVRYDYSRTVERVITELDIKDVRADHARAARRRRDRDPRQQGAGRGAERQRTSSTWRISGQIHAMRVPVEPDWSFDQMTTAFNDAYKAEFGNTLAGIPVMVINVRTTVEGKRARVERHVNGAAAAQAATAHARRQVHFGQWMDTPIYRRHDLKSGMTIAGPAIIEQSDTTTVVEPRMSVRVDRFHNVIVEAA